MFQGLYCRFGVFWANQGVRFPPSSQPWLSRPVVRQGSFGLLLLSNHTNGSIFNASFESKQLLISENSTSFHLGSGGVRPAVRQQGLATYFRGLAHFITKSCKPLQKPMRSSVNGWRNTKCFSRKKSIACPAGGLPDQGP